MFLGSEESWPFSEKYTEKYFDTEQCATLHTDVPWGNNNEADPQSRSAGGIPGWQTYVSMDVQGGTIYSSNVYPPSKYQLTPLLNANNNNNAAQSTSWGDCSEVVQWGVASFCEYTSGDNIKTSSSSSTSCFPDITMCLPYDDENLNMPNNITQDGQEMQQNNRGVCFSTATYTAAAALVCIFLISKKDIFLLYIYYISYV